MNTVPISIGGVLLNVQYSILREVKSDIAAMTLHTVSGKLISGPTAGRVLTREELDAMENAYADLIEGALWEWDAKTKGGDEHATPSND